MATECRRTKRVNKQRLVRLLTVIAVSIATAFTIGRLTAPTKTDTVTVTKTVEVPVYSTDKLPETSDIFYEITYSNTILGLMQNYEEVLQNAKSN